MLRLGRHSDGTARAGPFGGALVVLMIASAFMQYALGVLGPVLIEQFDLTRTQLGSLTSVLFVVASTASPSVGRLIDRYGARRMLPVPFAATLSGFLLVSVAPSYLTLLAAIVVAGSGMAFANPLSNKLVALHAAPGRQGLLMGVKQSGVQVAAVVAGLVMPTAVAVTGLRATASGTALVVGLGLLAVLALVPDDDTSAAPVRRVETDLEAEPGDLGGAARRRTTLLWISGYAMLMGSGIAAIYAYLPLYAVDVLGMSVPRAGVLASLIGMIGVVSRIVWGTISERLRHPATALAALAATAALAQALVWSAAVLGVWAIWTAAVVLGGSAVAWNAVAMFTVVRVLGTSGAGLNSGFVQLAFFSGFAIGPLAFGAVTDVVGGYSIGWGAIFGSFVAATVVSGRWAWATRAELPPIPGDAGQRSSR